MAVKLIAITPNAERLIEYAGRVCTNTTDKHTPTFIKARIKQGHESILEHASASFEIICSRSCLAQITRHRLASYSVESMRYVKQDDRDVIVPPSVMNADISTRAFAWKALGASDKAYFALCDAGIPKEDARYYLSIGSETRLLVTMNFRSWRHFINVRCDKAAQWEIRGIAYEILNALCEEASSVFEDLKEQFDAE